MQRPVVLITGVGRTVGIGAGIARKLAADGWDLALTYWSPYDARMPWGEQPDDVAGLTAELEAIGARVYALAADLERPEAAAAILAEVNEQLGPVRALVLSHCESTDSSILDTTLESFDRHFAVNVRASWQLIAEFARRLEGGDGRIVAMTSDHTVHNLPYGASKGALDRIVIAAARELGHLGVSSNVVNPGPVDTGWMEPQLRESLTGRQPTGRLGTPSDIANLVGFLLSEQGKWISGQLIKSDGACSV